MHRIPALILLAMALAVAPAQAAAPRPPSAQDAPIALLVDLSAGQTLFARQAEDPFLPASLTKVMTALVAFDLIRAGRLHEDAVVTVRPATAVQWSGKGTTLALRPAEQVRVSDLLRGVTIASANDAAVVLAEAALGSEAAWLEAMNRRARDLGMDGSRFASVNGMPDGGRTRVTARDLVRLAQALLTEHPALYRRYFTARSMAWQGGRLFSRNPLTGLVPGADGIKTGHTRSAGYTFLGAVERNGRRLVLVIGRAPSEAARAAAARSLVEWGYAAWDSRPFLAPGQVVGAVRVQGGAQRSVPVAVARLFTLAVPAGTRPQISARIVYRGPLRAPLPQGAAAGALVVSIAGQPDHALPLLTTTAVGPAGPIDRIVQGLLGLLE